MRVELLLLVTTCMIARIDTFGQCDETGTDVPYNATPLYLQQPDIVSNSSTPLSHPLLSTSGSNTWSMVNTMSDEFNGTSLNTTKWQDRYWWGRTQPTWINYNPSIADCPTCIQFLTLQGANKYLRLNVLKSPIVKRADEGQPNSTILSDGRVNQRTFMYRTGIVCSVNPSPTPYGYYEIRARLPKARYVIADYWLHMANNGNPGTTYYPGENFYHEMDGFETEDARFHHMNAHFKPDCPSTQYNFFHDLEAKGAYDLSSDFFTYAIQWEPNKVVYYMNNKPVHVIHEGQTGWPLPMDFNFNKRMWLIIGMEMDSLVGTYGRSPNSPAAYPAAYDVDYIRAYQRANYSEPFPTFNINGQPKALQVSTPLQLRLNEPVSICAAGSFSPDNTYFISVQECTSTGVLVGTEAMGWLNPTEIQSIHDAGGLNIRAGWLAAHGLTWSANKYYQIKFVADDTPWREMRQFVQVLPCNNSLNYRINGDDGDVISGLLWKRVSLPAAPFHVGNAASRAPVIMNASEARTCDGLFNLTIQISDASGAGNLGPWLGGWLTPAQVAQLPAFDIYSWAQSVGLPLQQGNYYRLKLAGQNPWTENTKLLYVESCTPAISFSINDDAGSTVMLPNVEHIQKPIRIMDLTPTCMRSDALYLVSLETSNALSARMGDEVTAWMTFDQVNRLNMYDFAAAHNFNILYNNWYRIAVSSDNGQPGVVWAGTLKLVKVGSCTDQPNFTINGQAPVVPSYVSVGTDEEIRLNAWTSSSCYPDHYYYLSVKRTNSVGTALLGYTEVAEWLDDRYTTNIGWPPFGGEDFPGGNLGWFNVAEFCRDRKGGYGNWPESIPTGTTPVYYLVSLCTDGQLNNNFQCKQVLVRLTGEPRDLLNEENTVQVDGTASELIKKVFVQEETDVIGLMNAFAADRQRSEITLFDSSGRTVAHMSNGRIEQFSSGSMAPGLYIIRAEP